MELSCGCVGGVGCGVGFFPRSFAGFVFVGSFSGAVGMFKGEFVFPLVRCVHHLVEVFGGQLLLCEVVGVGPCMSKVVGGPVCCVYHVCLFKDVVGGGM